MEPGITCSKRNSDQIGLMWRLFSSHNHIYNRHRNVSIANSISKWNEKSKSMSFLGVFDKSRVKFANRNTFFNVMSRVYDVRKKVVWLRVSKLFISFLHQYTPRNYLYVRKSHQNITFPNWKLRKLTYLQFYRNSYFKTVSLWKKNSRLWNIWILSRLWKCPVKKATYVCSTWKSLKDFILICEGTI